MTGDNPEPIQGLPPVEVLPSLSERVYVALKQSIAEQKLKPGSKLSVPRLAAALGVSRTPVKEALERLAQDGLVTMLPNRGAYVAILRWEDVNEIYQMREMLEGLATRLAADRMDDELLRRLRDLLQQGESAVRRRDIDAHIRIDLEFHRLIRARGGNRRLVRALDNLQDQIRIVFRTSATIPGRMPKALEEHRRILAALAAADPDQAERAARDHVRRIREAVLAHMRAAEGAERPLADSH
ncbi:MAG: GntR family transcriptional regulator [Armatimonadota bacterium]|nr:GntR family transcriptional regulator [Armatimonadota bacterium]MDR7427245.1 GntR family transcriptional regulator [Armatimonadota bacterium]MDR7463181.1 GntR family transcriptional regulator [Armatimonadota bacterium]MDR7468832.1 GntR family transcriptional regulator [Armatimonadota bacterium]MDR7475426.1 GntR family transcriptional regulator [Armatimonadota bacterium]